MPLKVGILALAGGIGAREHRVCAKKRILLLALKPWGPAGKKPLSCVIGIYVHVCCCCWTVCSWRMPDWCECSSHELDFPTWACFWHSVLIRDLLGDVEFTLSLPSVQRRSCVTKMRNGECYWCSCVLESLASQEARKLPILPFTLV